MQEWEHNKTASWGAPVGNAFPNSLGLKQLKWLEDVLVDAAEKKMSCIVVSYASLTALWYPSPDTESVQSLFEKVNAITQRTVIMCVNGHYHTNHIEMKSNILYFDVNTVINGSWNPKKEHHYTEEHGFTLGNYDVNGVCTGLKKILLTDLWQSVNTYYFEKPLDAIVKIFDDGRIEVTGSETTWRYNVVPETGNPAIMTKISSGQFALE